MPKIFVVDDDRDLVFMVKMALEKNGYEVQAFTNGLEALSAVKSGPPDLMIVDLTMPEMDGWRLCMKIRQENKCKELPMIIVLSGLVAESEMELSPDEPYNAMMAKPFDVDKLLHKIEELLKKK